MERPNVLVGVPLEGTARSILEKHADFEIVEFIEHDDLIKKIGDFDALISGGAQCNEQVLSQASKLKVIASHGVGYDTIDVEAATRHGVMVTNSPGVMAESVAEHAVALVLTLARKIVEANEDVKAGNAAWDKYRGIELWGKTFGQIGLGRIGWLIAKKMSEAFNMNVLAHDPYIDAERFRSCGSTSVALEKLLQVSDVISVSVPLNEETENLIDAEAFEVMEQGPIIVNTARAGVIDKESLIESLESESVSGAGLDVYELREDGDDPLTSTPNVVLTPHQAANTYYGFASTARATVENVVMALGGKKPKNLLNPEAF
ncbi:MAG: hydroxyacid dehydrogenase [Candidatus Bipolaricaulota bacterium]